MQYVPAIVAGLCGIACIGVDGYLAINNNFQGWFLGVGFVLLAVGLFAADEQSKRSSH